MPNVAQKGLTVMSDTRLKMTLPEFLGPLADFFAKLAGKDGDRWWSAFKRFLRKEVPWEQDGVRVVVETGVYTDAHSLNGALRKIGVTVRSIPFSMLKRLYFTKTRLSLNLVVTSVADLGFDERATYTSILAAARGRGLGICPGEAAALCLLQHKDLLRQRQFKSLMRDSACLYFATDPILDTDGYPSIFSAGRVGNNYYLGGHLVADDIYWPAQSYFVFVSSE